MMIDAIVGTEPQLSQSASKHPVTVDLIAGSRARTEVDGCSGHDFAIPGGPLNRLPKYQGHFLVAQIAGMDSIAEDITRKPPCCRARLAVHVGKADTPQALKVGNEFPVLTVDNWVVLDAIGLPTGNQRRQNNSRLPHIRAIPDHFKQDFHTLVSIIDIDVAVGIIGSKVDDDDIGS